MFQVKDIHPVSDFSRKPAEIIQRLKQTKRPEILTVNGSAAVVIQDAQAYEETMELLDSIQHIAAASEEFDQGKGKDVKLVFADLRKRLAQSLSNEEV